MFKGNIVLIGTVPPPAGGDAMWALDYLRYNEEYGNTVSLVNTSLIGDRAISVDENRILSDEIKRCISIWESIIKTVSNKTTDIVHMNINCSHLGTFRDLISAIILKLKRVPFVVHCHCNIVDQIGKSLIANSALKCIFKLSNRVIVLNKSSYDFVNIIDKSKVVIVPNFIAKNQFFANKLINKRLTKIVYVGHIRKTKGIDELLKVAKEFPEIEFTLVGPITEDYTEEKILNSSIGNVLLTGSISSEEVNSYLDQSDVFLFPSYTEGFSRALVEAMARGIPCIATDVGSNRGMLENKGGIIIDRKNPMQISAAIEKMYSYQTRKDMSKWNYHKSFNNYNIDAVMTKLFKIYEEVISESGK